MTEQPMGGPPVRVEIVVELNGETFRVEVEGAREMATVEDPRLAARVALGRAHLAADSALSFPRDDTDGAPS